MLAPEANWLAFTCSTAVATPPEPDNDTAPRICWPTAKVTAPAGEVVPEAAFTVAVKTVEPPALRVETVSVNEVVVAMGWLPFHAMTAL